MAQTHWWQDSVEMVTNRLSTHTQKGLSSKEAIRRLKKYGKNELPNSTRKTSFHIIKDQLSNIFVWLLLGASCISYLLGQHIDALIIVIILCATMSITFFQEYKAEASISRLLDITRPLATVIRDGIKISLAANKIVPGDLVYIEAGDIVVADGRIIEAINLAAEESSLTGESIACHKTTETISHPNVAIGDRKNMLFRGTAIVSGKGHMIITETGDATELGKVAHLLEVVNRRKTFFEARLAQLVNAITWLCLAVICVSLGIGLIKGIPPYDMFFIAVSLVVAAIPEVLPLTTTLALAYSTKRMAHHNILMRRLSAVETLGRVSVICSDKTGTLTKNEKIVTTIWSDGIFTQVTGQGYIPEGSFERDSVPCSAEDDPVLLLTLIIGVLCNTAYVYKKNKTWKFSGDASEAALLIVGLKAGLTIEALTAQYPLLAEFPFDATLRMMGSLRADGTGKKLYVKGAYDTMLPFVTKVMTNNGITQITTEKISEIQHTAKTLAQKGLRIFAVAYRLIDETTPYTTIPLNENLTFVGLFGMTDPLRPGIERAIATCMHAGIKTIMITGDHPDTAFAIGTTLGIIQKGSRTITGLELDTLSDTELKHIVTSISICARSSVTHKVRIVSALQANGIVVATTGDGINDAPALKIADIGIAMGKSGTALAKEASDVILLEDNFSSIVYAIKEGRGIFDSVRRNAGYIITTSVAELSIVCSGIAWGIADSNGNHLFMLLPIHLLWLDLVTEILMTTALINDPLNTYTMNRKPDEFAQTLLPVKEAVFPSCMGLIVALAGLFTFYCSSQINPITNNHSYTLIFTAMVIFELIALQIVRLYYGISMLKNIRALIAFIGIMIIQLILIYTPTLANIFHLTPLRAIHWCILSCSAVFVFISGYMLIHCMKWRTNKQ